MIINVKIFSKRVIRYLCVLLCRIFYDFVHFRKAYNLNTFNIYVSLAIQKLLKIFLMLLGGACLHFITQ